jgi:hypothetical protein
MRRQPMNKLTVDPAQFGIWLPDAPSGETFPRLSTVGLGVPVAGVCHMMRVWLPNGTYNAVKTVTGSAVPAAVTNSYVGLYDITAMAKVAASAESSAKWVASSSIAIPLTTSVVVNDPSGGKDFWIALLVGAGTTMPNFPAATQNSPLIWTDASFGPRVCGSHTTTGLTSLPANLVYGSTNLFMPYMMVLGS